VLRRIADDQFSIEVESPAVAQALARVLREAGGWSELVPGINSVVVQFDIATRDAEDVECELGELLLRDAPLLANSATVLEIPVLYGGDAGPDLDEVCALLGLSQDEFIALHTDGEHVVEMLGFTPGFAFIGGLDRRLNVPRRDAPRTLVPAGSIAVADSRTGLYALSSPGGWQLVGRTPEIYFDISASEPSMLDAGMRIRFRAITQTEFDAWN